MPDVPVTAVDDPQPPDAYGDPGVIMIPGVPHPTTEVAK